MLKLMNQPNINSLFGDDAENIINDLIKDVNDVLTTEFNINESYYQIGVSNIEKKHYFIDNIFLLDDIIKAALFKFIATYDKKSKRKFICRVACCVYEYACIKPYTPKIKIESDNYDDINDVVYAINMARLHGNVSKEIQNMINWKVKFTGKLEEAVRMLNIDIEGSYKYSWLLLKASEKLNYTGSQNIKTTTKELCENNKRTLNNKEENNDHYNNKSSFDPNNMIDVVYLDGVKHVIIRNRAFKGLCNCLGNMVDEVFRNIENHNICDEIVILSCEDAVFLYNMIESIYVDASNNGNYNNSSVLRKNEVFFNRLRETLESIDAFSTYDTDNLEDPSDDEDDEEDDNEDNDNYYDENDCEQNVNVNIDEELKPFNFHKGDIVVNKTDFLTNKSCLYVILDENVTMVDSDDNYVVYARVLSSFNYKTKENEMKLGPTICCEWSKFNNLYKLITF